MQQPWALGTLTSPQSPSTHEKNGCENLEITTRKNLSSHAFDYLSTVYRVLDLELQMHKQFVQG